MSSDSYGEWQKIKLLRYPFLPTQPPTNVSLVSLPHVCLSVCLSLLSVVQNLDSGHRGRMHAWTDGPDHLLISWGSLASPSPLPALRQKHKISKKIKNKSWKYKEKKSAKTMYYSGYRVFVFAAARENQPTLTTSRENEQINWDLLWWIRQHSKQNRDVFCFRFSFFNFSTMISAYISTANKANTCSTFH